MSYTFDKFMDRIVRDEKQQGAKVEPGRGQLTEERAAEIDPNRRRIQGREHWMNRTRMGSGGR
jgi:hypothetical protein